MFKPNPGQIRMQKLLTMDEITRLLVYSGSRSGKTFMLVRSILLRGLIAEESRHAIIRKEFNRAKKYIWLDTLPAVVNICFPNLKYVIHYNKSDHYLILPNGSEIWIGGLDDKERADKILGGEYNTIYFNETSEIPYPPVLTAITRLAKKSYKEDGRQLVNKAYFDENPPNKMHWTYKLFFEGVDPITNQKIDTKKYGSVFLRPEENAENLADEYIETLKTLPGDKRKRFYEGAFQDAIKGALFKEETINRYRLHQYPDLVRIVIAVDPAVTKTENSDETGIMVEGLGSDGHIYLLADLSGYYTPREWADRVILAYDKWGADAVVGETNNGGDLVQTNIQYARPDISFIQVWAKRNKITRAEPVASMYDRGFIHHVGSYPDLEYQMVTYTGADQEKSSDQQSPDRMDAMVYGVTELASPPTAEEIVEDDFRVRISKY